MNPSTQFGPQHLGVAQIGVVSAAGLAPISGEVVTQFQSDSSRTDSPVRVLNAQPGSRVSSAILGQPSKNSPGMSPFVGWAVDETVILVLGLRGHFSCLVFRTWSSL